MKASAFLFPGQGSQYIGMGKTLYEQSESVRQIFKRADDALGFHLTDLCFEGEESELIKTEYAQPALLTVSYAMFQYCMREFGISPKYLAGQSLGEISALACAEAIAFEDAVKLVAQRGKFMQEAVSHDLCAMAAVIGLEYDSVQKVCDLVSNENDLVVISNYNAHERFVISGHKKAVELAGDYLKSRGASVVPLHVSAPFHSPLMRTAAQKFELELQKYKFHNFTYPVISNVSGQPYQKAEDIKSNLALQIVSQVQWKSTMEYLSSQGVMLTIECGPRRVLCNMMKEDYPAIESYSVDSNDDLLFMIDHFHKKVCNKADKMMVLTRCMAIAVCTQNRNEDNEEYQKGAVASYKKIESMVEELESKHDEPTLEQLYRALELLRTIFYTKRTSLEDQRQRFNQIFDETNTRELLADFIMP